MEPLPLAHALLLGIVEGLTEFLPVSSTGHLIVAGSLLGQSGDTAKAFEIAIQSGAMLSVVWEYRARFGRAIAGLRSDPAARRFALNLAIAFLPAALLGYLFAARITSTLFAPVPVAIAFVAGAFVILWAERRQRLRPTSVRVDDVDAMTPLDALKVGIAQAFALIPGTSRSGATIIGGMLFGGDRVLVLPRGPHPRRRRRVLAVARPRGAVRRRPPRVRRRLRGRVRLRVRLHPLADPLREPSRLRAVRLVPHRVRRRGARHRVDRPRALVGPRAASAAAGLPFLLSLPGTPPWPPTPSTGRHPR